MLGIVVIKFLQLGSKQSLKCLKKVITTVILQETIITTVISIVIAKAMYIIDYYVE